MPLRWRKRPQWPPFPFVEDEFDSLSRELHGFSYLGELPGIEGVHARGTINQYPVLLDVEVLIVSNISSNAEEKTAPGTPSSGFNSKRTVPGTETRKETKQNPLGQFPGENQSHCPEKYPVRSPPRPQDAPLNVQALKPAQTRVPEVPKNSPSSDQRPIPRQPEASVWDSTIRTDRVPVSVPSAQENQTTPSRQLPAVPKEGQGESSPTVPRRSGSVKYARTPKPLPADPRPSSDCVSDSATVRRKNGPDSDRSHAPHAEKYTPSSGLSVAERLEEKLRLRRARESGDASQDVTPQSNGTLPSKEPCGQSVQVPAPDRAAAKPEESSAPVKPAFRSQSLDRAQPASAQKTRRRAVSFAEKPSDQSVQTVMPVPRETSLSQLQPPRQDVSAGSADSSRSSSPSGSLSLLPCPRAIPVAGYQDWHTIQGLNHLDICPSCIKQMRKSKFRDRFILSAPKPRTEAVRCSMSEPWTRLTWAQTIKKKLDSLDLLLQITRPPPGTKPCTGRIINDQYWGRVIDPETNMYLPQFNVCSACVRNVRLLMPVHRDTFQRSRIPRERVCDFVTDSPRFIRYIDALDLAANRAEQENAPPDISEFLAYARRKVVIRDCRRSRLIFNTWHYMPQLPEFTVCEDCYDDVVWPLAKARFPIARRFSTVMRLVPGDGLSSSREASCQLYSPRIRAKFTDAVRRNDMAYLTWVALTRREAEQRFRDRQAQLLEDERLGYDCSVELRKNLEEWKRYE